MGEPLSSTRQYVLSRRLFLRLLGFVHLIAFASLAFQISGLVGENGIIPAAETLERAASLFGTDRFVRFPTLFWFSSSDASLHCAVSAGIVLSILLVLYIAPGPVLASLWVLYLSLFSIAVDFLAFQWDEFLLEVTFLAALWAPWRLNPCPHVEPPPSDAIRLLFKFLLFRLYFMAGVVKLVTSEPAWWNLTALDHYFEVTPLPTPLSWYFHNLPPAILAAGSLAVLLIHLGFGLFLVAPGRWSLVGSIPNLALQILILVTANYGFFNIVTMATHVTLLDDELLRRICPRCFRPPAPANVPSRLPRSMAATISILLLLLASLHIAQRLEFPAARAGFSGAIVSSTFPWRVANFYGPWPGVPTRRLELVFEGSNDGSNWREYVFRYKPGPVDRMPGSMVGYLPRLDYCLWFAQFGENHESHWLPRFVDRLLEGRPEVLRLLEETPFHEKPPRFVRVVYYDYRFATPEERCAGAWWIRRTAQIPEPRTFHRREFSL